MTWGARWFDDMSRTVAEPRSRRVILGGLVGSVFALLPAAASAQDGGQDDREDVCRKGLTTCRTDTRSDPANCGACGHVCPTGQICSGGVCSCPSGLSYCGNLCVNPGTDNYNCGACGHVCPPGKACLRGACVTSCPPGQLVCGDLCVSPGSDNLNCGGCGKACTAGTACVNGVCGGGCPAGQTSCNGQCVDLTTSTQNCGACGTSCPAGSTCRAGVCGAQCAPGQTLCGGVCTDLATDGSNCGGCGRVCPAGSACRAGACAPQCPAGQVICGNTCVNVATDPNNCGGCGRVCSFPNGTGRCVGGVCTIVTCNAGFSDCNGVAGDGCETNISADPNNCGACGRVCGLPNATARCVGGVCTIATCNAGYADCNGNASDGCEINLMSDVRNCGACGNVCSFANASGACVGGVCTIVTCNAGFADCNRFAGDGYEVNLQTDPSNCGACGRACPPGPFGRPGVCTAGVCS